MSAEVPDELVVQYGVKELLADIKDSVGRIDNKLDTKAEKVDLIALDQRVTALEHLRSRAIGALFAAAAIGGGAGFGLGELLR